MRSAGTYAGYHFMLLDLEATTWVTDRGVNLREAPIPHDNFVSALRNMKPPAKPQTLSIFITTLPAAAMDSAYM